MKFLALLGGLAANLGCTELDVFTSGEPWRPLPYALDAPRGTDGRSTFDGTTWRITSELSPTCEELGCDVDLDGLSDAWEAMLLDDLRPIVRIGGGEDLLHDPEGVIGSTGRVTPASGDDVLVAIVLAYARDYGRCGFTEHSGDSERVALRIGRDGTVREVYTAAHEGTAVDAGELRAPAELAFVTDPVNRDARWYVWASEGKHATYPSPQACAEFAATPCVAELCPGLARSDALELLVPVVDAGEPDAGDGAWDEAWPFPFTWPYDPVPFCGDRWAPGTSCATSIRDKLVADPFDGTWRD